MARNIREVQKSNEDYRQSQLQNPTYAIAPNEKMYFERLLNKIRPLLPGQGEILDAGCGIGKDAFLLHQWGYTLAAVDEEPYPEAWKHYASPGLRFLPASVEALPFADGAFAAVWAKDVLHHVKNPVLAVQELLRVTRPGGPVVLIEANRFNPVLYLHMTLLRGHEHFSRRQFRRLLLPLEPAVKITMAESRVFPVQHAGMLKVLDFLQNVLEGVPWFRPWLTYQVAVLPGRGQRA